MTDGPALYDDGRISCDDDGVVIGWYYPWGAKKVPYRSIRAATTFPLGALRGRGRVWGSTDFTHWYNLDGGRPKKETGIELDVGGRVRPTITPDDPDAVVRIIEEHRPPG